MTQRKQPLTKKREAPGSRLCCCCCLTPVAVSGRQCPHLYEKGRARSFPGHGEGSHSDVTRGAACCCVTWTRPFLSEPLSLSGTKDASFPRSFGKRSPKTKPDSFSLGLSLWNFIPQAFIEHRLCARVLVSKPDRPPEFTFGSAATVPHDEPSVGGAQGSEEESRMASWRQRFQAEIFKGSAKVSLV